jgi:hypothetical protein
LALHLARAPQSQAWQRVLRAVLLARQVGLNVADAGSWEPRGAVGPFSSRAAGTALAILSLQVHYRFR